MTHVRAYPKAKAQQTDKGLVDAMVTELPEEVSTAKLLSVMQGPREGRDDPGRYLCRLGCSHRCMPGQRVPPASNPAAAVPCQRPQAGAPHHTMQTNIILAASPFTGLCTGNA